MLLGLPWLLWLLWRLQQQKPLLITAVQSTLIAEIADAGEAQSSGIAEINQAVGQIDTMTQQNAALVEQLAAAAQSLQGQSGQLNASMGSFRVGA